MRSYMGYVAQLFRSSFISFKALSVDVLKFGPHFSKTLAELERSQWYTKEQFDAVAERETRGT